MDCAEFIFSYHALARMFERQVSPADVRVIVSSGEAIAEYTDDRPYPSFLVLGYVAGRALHAVVARDTNAHRCYIITVYQPDLAHWDAGFRRRKQ